MRGSEEERCTGSDSKGIKTREKIKGKRKNTLPSAGDKYQLVQKSTVFCKNRTPSLSYWFHKTNKC